MPVARTPSFGCSTKWSYKAEGRKAEIAEIEKEPVNIKPVTADDLKALRKNPSGKLLLVDFWATWCGPCVKALPEFETMYRMYRHRQFDLVAVSANYPDAKAAVLALAVLAVRPVGPAGAAASSEAPAGAAAAQRASTALARLRA